MSYKIERIRARQILDSRGTPTVQAEVWCGEKMGIASSPSGASTGSFEAHELRDGIADRYNGKSVEKAVSFINTELRDRLLFRDVRDQRGIDRILIEADGTDNKSRIGANALLALSLAVAKCAAKVVGVPFYRYLGGCNASSMPVPMLNVINGGKHSDNSLDIQEFMIIPKRDEFPKMLENAVKVYNSLKNELTRSGLSTAVGDEGGFAPQLGSDTEALDVLVKAVEKAGYECGKDFFFGLDVASSEFKNAAADGTYLMEKSGKKYLPAELAEHYGELLNKYPIISIEDPFAEDDWNLWASFTESHRGTVLVGDDLFVTNRSRLLRGIECGAANAILIKPNQIGTLTETLDCIDTAKKAGYKVIVSHRSGETEDTSIADIAVATSADMIKSGAPARSERTAKYNRLLKIYEETR
ncbi:MAG: phosphopyruvate hydratase [Ruminococcaceae bacterium]|nr:phosphopyruvate hydratase [Oscillospiraceae bacterium]